MILFIFLFLFNIQEKNSGVLYLKSQIALDLGEYDKAINYLENALKSNPNSPFLKLELSKILTFKGAFNEALNIIKAFSPPESLKADYFSLKFYLDLMLDDIENAFEDHKILNDFELSKENKIYIIEAIQRKIDKYIYEESPDNSINLLEIYIKYFPQEIKIQQALLNLYLEVMDIEKASNLAKNLELNNITYPVIANFLYFLLERNDCKNILEFKEKLINSNYENIISVFPFCLLKEGEIEEAISTLNKIISLNPKNEAALNFLSEVKIIDGDYQGAEEILNLFPRETEEQVNTIREKEAILYQIKGEYTKVEEVLFKLLNKFESKEKIKILKKIYYFYKDIGNCYKTLEYSFKILEEDENDLYSYLKVAEAYLMIEDIENAKIFLEIYNEMAGTESFVDSVWLLLEYGYLNDAYYILEKLEPLKNKIKQINQLWGFYYFKKNDVYKMEEALKKDFDDPSSLNLLGYFLIEKEEKIDWAISLIEKALEYEPNNGSFIDSLGWGYYKKNDYEKAYEILRKAIFLEPYNGIILSHLGDVCMKLGNFKEAFLRYKQAISFQKPEMEDVLKKMEEALKKFKKFSN